MKKLIEKVCSNCNTNYQTRNHKQLCCSWKCSNVFQAKIRKNTILDNGKSISQIYSEKSANKLKQNGWYNSDTLKDIAKNNFKNILKSEKVIFKLKETIKRKKQTLDENGLNLFQISTKKALNTKEKKGLIIPLDKKNNYEKYKYLVWQFTNKNNLSLLENFQNRARAKIKVVGYHLDHIYSIFDGFINNVPPEVVGHISNLRFVTWEKNISKNNKSEKTLKELFNDAKIDYYEYYEENYIELKKSKNSAYKMNNTKRLCDCGVETTIGNYTRWHGKNCKNLKQYKEALF